MKTFLKLWFGLVLVTMLTVTTWAQMQEGFLTAVARIPGDPWFVATLFDTYFAFLAFFFWVCYRERSALARVIWLVLILALGNIAMAAYALLQLARLKPEQEASALFARPAA
jgi:predicted permease